MCRSIAGHVLKDPQDIDEVVSDTYLAVWNTIPPEQPQSLSAYVSRICRNLSIDKYRNNCADRRNPDFLVSLEELAQCLPSGKTPEEVLDSAIITDAINAFLATLTQTNRYIFIRRYYYMESSRQIAKNLTMSDNAVRGRLLRMREQLRAKLEKEGISI